MLLRETQLDLVGVRMYRPTAIHSPNFVIREGINRILAQSTCTTNVEAARLSTST